jgi:SAM-dependent methyltransferase
VSHGQWKAADGLDIDEWVAFLAGLRTDTTLPPPPAMPSEEIQTAYVGSSGLAAMREAGEFYRQVQELLRSRDGAVGRLLDFGCGWGRIYRLFLRDSDKLVGVDIDSGCIAICRSALPDGDFEVCGVEPPLGFAEHSFDTVAAYSVFSHLAERVFTSWMLEFSRVLAPGGRVFFTTLKRAHLAVWDGLSQSGNAHYRAALRDASFEKGEWSCAADQGERVLFVPTGGGDMRSASFYGEAIISRSYLDRVLPELGFELLVFSDQECLPQVFVAAGKAGSPRRSP